MSDQGKSGEGGNTSSSPNVVIVPADIVQAAAAKGSAVQVVIATAHGGPFPPPEQLRTYNDVVPGLAETLVVEFKAEARHRRRIQAIGQLGTLSIAGLSIIAGALLGYALNSPLAALAVIGLVCGAVGTTQLLEYWFKAK
jgi:uncharacterized membrane protein